MLYRRMVLAGLIGCMAVGVIGCGETEKSVVEETGKVEVTGESDDEKVEEVEKITYWLSDRKLDGSSFKGYTGEVLGIDFPCKVEDLLEYDTDGELEELLKGSKTDEICGMTSYAWIYPEGKDGDEVTLTVYDGSDSDVGLTVRECLDKNWWYLEQHRSDYTSIYGKIVDVNDIPSTLTLDDMDRVVEKYGVPNYVGFQCDVNKYTDEEEYAKEYAERMPEMAKYALETKGNLYYSLIWEEEGYVIVLDVAETNTYRNIENMYVLTPEAYKVYKGKYITLDSIDNKDKLVELYVKNNCYLQH